MGKKLREGYSDAIDHFSEAYRPLHISVTPMVTKNLWKRFSFQNLLGLHSRAPNQGFPGVKWLLKWYNILNVLFVMTYL